MNSKKKNKSNASQGFLVAVSCLLVRFWRNICGKKFRFALAKNVSRWVILFFVVFFATTAFAQDTYSVSGSRILKNWSPTYWRGVNAMHVFGGGSSGMNSWGIDMVREFIGNMRDNPLTGSVQQINGEWLYSLQSIADNNRANGKITIFCPFGWDGMSSTPLLGNNPSQTWWWDEYKARYREIANQFKDQPDVWLELWNEPYWWDRSHGYSDDLWLSDMQQMVDNIRSTGATNIIVVPGAETGQDESVILAKGKKLLAGRKNIIFDIHAYENWLKDSQANIEARMQKLSDSGFAVIFGEVAPRNAEFMNPLTFLNAARNKRASVLAWLWKHNGNDKNALLDSSGNPNDNNNYNWGSTYKAFAQEKRAANPFTNWIAANGKPNSSMATPSNNEELSLSPEA
ncbi:MAG: cellulase family glycosylhydrolase [Chlorogloeopsis fritschii C42_A2020_084]|nr:cellulase family glycosylhydrolase [Chlorogloeopsis fritschii]MBF2005470.1 cellulase family glycosylhydrolase [Chlorogloeopsis fritschii C42_A2020_084]